MEETGFCWKCGLPTKGLFCNKKHEEQYNRKQENQIKKGKRKGYGVAGSTH